MKKLNKDIKDVRLLIASDPGTGSQKRIARKAAIVLFAASWEAFIEDLAEASFKFLLKQRRSHDVIPDAVKSLSVDGLRSSNDSRDVWRLAGLGWRKVLKDHHHKCKDEFIQSVNTPDVKNINAMFFSLIGLRNLSKNWKWHGNAPVFAKRKLESFLRLRGQIAHRVALDRLITSGLINDHVDFIFRLAVKSHNTVRTHLIKTTGKDPWVTYKFGNTE